MQEVIIRTKSGAVIETKIEIENTEKAWNDFMTRAVNPLALSWYTTDIGSVCIHAGCVESVEFLGKWPGVAPND